MSAPPPRRLDPCPCGSGKRYRDCHGALAAAPAPPAAPPALAQAIELRAQGDTRGALARVRDALSGAAQSAALLTLQGLLLQDGLDLEGALRSFEAAIAAAPGYAEAHFDRALALLLKGDYRDGWKEYEWRTRLPGYADYANYPFGMPRWRGEPLAGRSLLVHAEQGHGDTIQFARFIAPLASSGATVDVFCHPPLVSLLGRTAGVRRALGNLAERPAHDFHAPIADLAAAHLREPSSPHWLGPYVAPLPERAATLAPLAAGPGGPRIGIAWRGSPRHLNDRNRSLTREAAQALVTGEGTFVNLQLGEAPLREGMIDAAARIADWEDTAAIVDSLDLVVAVDTAVAHLAGAMGKPVFVLLPFSPDWRWGLGTETTPWYPSMRLFRQPAPGAWAPAIEAAVKRYAEAAR